MITAIQKKFLERLVNGEISKADNPKRYSMMMIRIRQQIDKSLENAKWLVDNYIEILKDEKAEINDETLERHRRFKAFTYVTNKLNPISEIQEVELKTVLKKLAQLYPEVYIEIIKKKFRNESEVNEN